MLLSFLLHFTRYAQLCLLLWKVARHVPEPPQPFTLLAVIKFTYPGFPLIVSGRRSLFCLLNPAGVFLGILRKTLGVDPGMTPVQFQACEELHSLELSLILQRQEFSWSLRQAIRDCWRRRWYRTVSPSYTTRREAGDTDFEYAADPFFSPSLSALTCLLLKTTAFLAKQCKQIEKWHHLCKQVVSRRFGGLAHVTMVITL